MAHRIFIAEDDPALRQMYRKAFSRHRYIVEISTNGEEALSKLDLLENKPDVFLLDIIMPKVNGLEVLQGIKEDARYNHIPVIMLTNMSGKQSEGEKAMGLGASLYLGKNQLSLHDLIENVDKVIAESATRKKVQNKTREKTVAS